MLFVHDVLLNLPLVFMLGLHIHAQCLSMSYLVKIAAITLYVDI